MQIPRDAIIDRRVVRYLINDDILITHHMITEERNDGDRVLVLDVWKEGGIHDGIAVQSKDFKVVQGSKFGGKCSEVVVVEQEFTQIRELSHLLGNRLQLIVTKVQVD